MSIKRASRLEKRYQVFGIVFLFAILGIIAVINANHKSYADIEYTDGGIRKIDCDTIIKKNNLYNADNNLGSLGMFGVIGFERVKAGNFKKGFATNYYEGNNGGGSIGEQDYQGPELIVYTKDTNQNAFAYNTRVTGSDSMFVLGSNVSARAKDGWSQWYAEYTINGSTIPATKLANAIGETPQSTEANIYQEDQQKFIDLDALKNSAIDINQKLVTEHASNQNVQTNSTESWNQQTITVAGSGLAVLNMSARSNDWDAGYKIDNLGSTQTLIINFDMSGRSNTQIGGLEQGSNSNVILNVYDSSKADKQYTGDITVQNMRGYILAPSATLNINNNLWGTAVVNIANVSQSHAGNLFQGNFPVSSITPEQFGVCDDGGDAPVGQHKLTVNHYLEGESEPFDSKFYMIDDGEGYTAELADEKYYEYKGLYNEESAPFSGEITEDIIVNLKYTPKNISFKILHTSTDENATLIEEETITKPSTERYTVKSKKYENYKYKNASASLTQQVKDFGESITLYYDPWTDPTTRVTEDLKYENTSYYVESKLGQMGGFHMVGFTEIDARVRVYGNILTNRVTNMNEFGLVHFPLINYVKEVGEGITNPKFSPNDDVNTVLVVGEDVDIDTADNGARWTINGAKVDIPQIRRVRGPQPTNIWREKDVQFIDLDAIKDDTVALSKFLASYDENIDTEADFSDQNAKSIRILNDEGLNVINLTYNDLDESHDIFVDGFDKEKKATLVINIDMAGHQGDFTFAGTRLRWGPNDIYNESFTGGENITREDAQLNNTITLNFIDSSSPDGLYHGHVRSARPMLAYVLIPEGQFTILSSTFAGAILADRISGTGNSYMILFDHSFYYPEPEEIPESPKTHDPVAMFIAAGALFTSGIALAIVKAAQKRRN